jgi:hypothetical protein
MAYGPFPGVELEFDLNANPVDDANAPLTVDAAVAPLLAGVQAANATDLIVISHGWNNDKDEARALYDAFFASAQALIAAGAFALPADRRPYVAAVIWPSARFVDASEIPGGAAGDVDMNLLLLQTQLSTLRGAFAGNAGAQGSIDAALAAAPNLDTDPNAASAFVNALSALPSDDTEEHDTITTAVATAVAAAQQPGADVDEKGLLATLGANPPPGAATAPAPSGGNAGAGDAGGAADIFSSIKAGALSLASIFTYKTMKERAGVVGRTGLTDVLGRVRAAFPNLRIHLAGHSFGARLVTSAANTPWNGTDATNQATTLALLQGAFSHFAFAVNYLSLGHNGGFRDVVGKPTVTGSIAITHSSHDMAVGWAYPAASALLGQVASGVASANPFGGMGADGAVSTPEAIFDDLGDVGHVYTPLPDRIRVRNLMGDPFISGHGDITNKQVVYAFLVNAFGS